MKTNLHPAEALRAALESPGTVLDPRAREFLQWDLRWQVEELKHLLHPIPGGVRRGFVVTTGGPPWRQGTLVLTCCDDGRTRLVLARSVVELPGPPVAVYNGLPPNAGYQGNARETYP